MKLQGEEWTARSTKEEIIEEGTKVKIIEISGVKLMVDKV